MEIILLKHHKITQGIGGKLRCVEHGLANIGLWPEDLRNNIELWPQNADKNEDDDDTRSNVNIGLWPDDVGRQCTPLTMHTVQ